MVFVLKVFSQIPITVCILFIVIQVWKEVHDDNVLDTFILDVFDFSIHWMRAALEKSLLKDIDKVCILKLPVPLKSEV